MAITRDPSNKELGGGFSSRLPSPKEVTLSPRSNEPQNQKSPTKAAQSKPQAPVKSKNYLNFLTRNNHVITDDKSAEKDIQIVTRIVLQPKNIKVAQGSPKLLAKTTSAVLIIDRVEQVLKNKEQEFQNDYGLIKE